MLHVTSLAVSEIKRLLKDRGHQDYGMRVGVKGGGCSGLSYLMDAEERPQ